MAEWMDTPLTVMTTKAPEVLKKSQHDTLDSSAGDQLPLLSFGFWTFWTLTNYLKYPLDFMDFGQLPLLSFGFFGL